MDRMQSGRSDEQGQGYHVPVMLAEALDMLGITPDGVYVDCTFGGGGHSMAILSRLGTGGRLVAFDQDEDVFAHLPEDPRLLFIPQNFRHLSRFLRLYKVGPVDGLLADLGVSSHQFDEPGRGFSIRFEGPLDMRMDKRQEVTAAGLLEDLSEEELHKVLGRYGEVANARTLARALCAARSLSPIRTAAELREAVAPLSRGNPNRYMAQVFQALRIAVNDELGALEELLRQLPTVLKPGGTAVFITFHSLEDRIVKRYFKEGATDGEEKDEVYGTRAESRFEPIVRKPVLPSEEEVVRNPRARSAKLRAYRLKFG
jgi:16S rRNA (cytosine1402-N4)-methyltransferase